MGFRLWKLLTLLFMVVIAFSAYQFNYLDQSKETRTVPEEKNVYVKPVDKRLAKKASQGLVSEKKKKVKGLQGKDSPDLFAEWHRGIRTGLNEKNPSYPMNYQITELLKARGLSSTQGLAKKSKASVIRNWTERGPGNVAGRTRGLLIDPRDTNFNTWIVGSVGGGVWKTTDAGANWTHLTADLPNLATSALAWSASDYNTIYAGTGEGFGNVDQIDGSGIWKTTNGGTNWTQLTATATNPDFDNVTRIIVDPANADIVLASVAAGYNYLAGEDPSSGIYRSINGGTSWTKTYTATAGVEHLIANPLNFKTQFATVNGTTVVKSTDGGVTWTESAQGITIAQVARMEIAMAPSDTSVLYISAEGGATGSVLYISTDAGATWTATNEVTTNDVNWLGEQGWYDNTIAVNPYDANEVFVGGINIWKHNVLTTVDTSDGQVSNVEAINTASFLSFINWGGPYYGGVVGTGADFYDFSPIPVDAVEEDFVSVEIRFGPGQSQKAYRYIRNASTGTFEYFDFVDVPFTAWDITNNKQITISFRDWAENGVFDLIPYDANNVSREYLSVNAVDYNASVIDTNFTKDWGVVHKNIFTMWFIQATGTTWDPNNLPPSAFRITWDAAVITRNIATTNITDGYNPDPAKHKGVHVDQHNLVFAKVNDQTQSYFLLNGNDGGVSFSRDGGTTFSQTGNWRGATGIKGYNTTQFYGIDKAPGVDRYIGGMQDNGSWYTGENPDANSDWIAAPSGDGYEPSWHYKDINKMIETSQFNSIYKSVNGGNSWTSIDPPDENGGPFFTKIGKSKQDPDLIFAVGGSGVWRSDNFGDDWTLIEMPSGFDGTSSFSQVKISLANPQIVWSARNMTSTSVPYVSTDGGLTFTATTNYAGVDARISGFETHPTEDSTAFTLLSVHGHAKVLKTTDLGQTWTELSGFGENSSSSNGFPDAAVYSLLVMPFNTNIIWAGTEIGLFESLDAGATWAYADNGFPAVAVYDMVVVNDEVVVATHGRGVWTAEFTELQNYEPPLVTLSPRLASIGERPGIVNISVKLPSAYDSTNVVVNGNKLKIMANAALDTTLSYVYTEDDNGEITAYVSSYKNGREYKSPTGSLTLIGLNTAVDGYESDFVNNADDFVGNGLSVSLRIPFSRQVINSNHPYTDNDDFIITLKTLIRVAQSNAEFEYSDIAIVEPGEAGSVFGDSDFWDYVIVEGSTDGINWIPFADGYDARFNSVWEQTYINSSSVSETMFIRHDIDMLQTFNAGDEVIIRFRLHADANTNGWGWAIDDINIQQGTTSIEDNKNIPIVFNLSQNYPNPFNPTTKIDFSLPQNSKVKLKIYDIAGREVATLINAPMTAGSHTFEWQAENFASGAYLYRIEAGNFVQTRKMLLLK